MVALLWAVLAWQLFAGFAPPPPPEAGLPPVAPRRWTSIVVHHSAGSSGNAATFHRWHLQKKWDGLGYHFVIGNGTGAPDGAVETGWRWIAQREGAHAGQTEYNQEGIGICLVGNFEEGPPSEAQYEALRALCQRLMLEHGIEVERIVGHRHVKPTTLCPGKHFPLERLRRDLREG